MIKGVIFDMDGLMFDTEQLYTKLWWKAGMECGEDFSDEFLDCFRGMNPQAVQDIFRERIGEDFDYIRCRDLKRQYTIEYMEEKGAPLKKGLMELLDYLRKSEIQVAVATSTARYLAEIILKSANVFEYVDVFVPGDMVERSKPFPDIFWKAASLMGIDPKECLVLEDSTMGVQAGIAAGGATIHIPDMQIVPEEILRNATATLPDLGQVINWIQNENK